MTIHEYRKGQSLPAIGVVWREGDKSLAAFADGWTFKVEITAATTPTVKLAEKTAGVIGADVEPNVLIDWLASDFESLPAALNGTLYLVHLSAVRDVDGKVRGFDPGDPIRIKLYPALTNPP